MTYTPDVLAPGLDVIFCGLNPGSSSFAAGHNFAHRSNRFWRAIHLAGFTDRQLAPHEERKLLTYGCGITAAVARPTRSASSIKANEFQMARTGLEAKLDLYRPRMVAFLGKAALSAMTCRPSIDWGRQAEAFGPAPCWVLPHPSGLNRAFSFDALVQAYAALKNELYKT